MAPRESRHAPKQGIPRGDSATNPPPEEEQQGSRGYSPRPVSPKTAHGFLSQPLRPNVPRSEPAQYLDQDLPSRSRQPNLGRPQNYAHTTKPPGDPRKSGTKLTNQESLVSTKSVQGADPVASKLLTSLMGDFNVIGEQQYGSLRLFCQGRPDIFEEDTEQLQRAAVEYLRQDQTAHAERTVRTLLMLRDAKRDLVRFLGLLESLQTNEETRKELSKRCQKTLKALKEIAISSSQSSAGPRLQGGKIAETETGTPRPSQPQQQVPSPRHPIPTSATALTVDGAPSVGMHSTRSSSIPSIVPEVGSGVASTIESVRPRPVVRKGSFAPSDLDTQPGTELQDRSGRNPKRFVGPISEVGRNLSKTQQFAYETFSKAFVVYQGEMNIDRVFGKGSVIAVFWHENYGLNLPSKMKGKVVMPTPGRKGPGFVSQVSNGEIVYSHVRRFIVVNQRQGFSTAIPISTYGGRGLSSRAESINETEQLAHTIVYAHGTTPIRLEREPVFTKEPICIQLTARDERLSESSRLYYAKPQSIDHNIKVKHIGHVIKRDVGELMLTYWRENGWPVNQQ